MFNKHLQAKVNRNYTSSETSLLLQNPLQVLSQLTVVQIVLLTHVLTRQLLQTHCHVQLSSLALSLSLGSSGQSRPGTGGSGCYSCYPGPGSVLAVRESQAQSLLETQTVRTWPWGAGQLSRHSGVTSDGTTRDNIRRTWSHLRTVRSERILTSEGRRESCVTKLQSTQFGCSEPE